MIPLTNTTIVNLALIYQDGDILSFEEKEVLEIIRSYSKNIKVKLSEINFLHKSIYSPIYNLKKYIK